MGVDRPPVESALLQLHVLCAQIATPPPKTAAKNKRNDPRSGRRGSIHRLFQSKSRRHFFHVASIAAGKRQCIYRSHTSEQVDRHAFFLFRTNGVTCHFQSPRHATRTQRNNDQDPATCSLDLVDGAATSSNHQQDPLISHATDRIVIQPNNNKVNAYIFTVQSGN